MKGVHKMSSKSNYLIQFIVFITFASIVGCWNKPEHDPGKSQKYPNSQTTQDAGSNETDKTGQKSLPQQTGTANLEINFQTDEMPEPLDISQLQQLVPLMDSEAPGILADMVKTYKEANGYGDHGYVELKYELANGTPHTEIRNCTFAFQKPNKVRMEVNQGQLVSDGTMLRAFATGNTDLFGQIIEKRAPSLISIKDFYSDFLLANLMDLGVPPEVIFVPPQIVLLLAQDPLQTLLPEGAEIKTGFSEYIISRDGQEAIPCDTIIVIDKLTGTRTYWIERGTNLLMRMEIGVSHIRNSEVKPISIKIELEKATIVDLPDVIPNEAFMMQKPPGSTTVQELRQPGLAMLGKRPEETICANEENQQINLAASTQKGVTVAVLFVTDPQAVDTCKAAILTLQRLAFLFEKNPDVNCFPVALDEERVRNNEISETLKSWGINLPYLRQPGRELMQRLSLTDVPTFLIFGPNGNLQLIEPGIPGADDLATFVDSALAGKDPYKEIHAYYEAQKTAYHQSVEGFVSFDIFRTEPEYVQIADRTAPQTMTMTEVWRRTDFVSPGNPHVVGNALLIPHDFQQFSVLGSDDGKTQVMNENGDPAVITPQDISAEMPLHYLKSATGKDGQRYFVATGINQKQIFVFDKDLKHVLTWPPVSTVSQEVGQYEIAALQMADLTGDGDPEIVVGYRVLAENTRRLAAIDLSGTTLWEDRSVTEPDQIAIVLKNKVPHIWVVERHQDTNALAEFNALGRRLRDWNVDAVGGLIWKIFAADLDGDGNSEVLAILPRVGELVAAGLNTNASLAPVLWEHPVSPGSHGVKSFEFVVTGDINGDDIGEWCVAAADGTIYFFDQAGKLLDSFATGELLSGMAIVPDNNTTYDAATLVLATSKDRYDTPPADDAVIAWKAILKNPPQMSISITTPEPEETVDTVEADDPVDDNA